MSENLPSAGQCILLTLAYDGSLFHGFASQANGRTVAGELLTAVQMVDPSVRQLRGASRTDAGVHARGQAVAFDVQRSIPPRGWVLGIGSHLPADISVRHAMQVPAGFDPRRHALHKHYRYTLLCDACRDPFWERFSWRIVKRLDVELARREANSLTGTHDFAAFRSSADQRTSTQRTLSQVRIDRTADERLLLVDVHGTAFLHNMVRIIVGTLVDIGCGRLAPGAVTRAFASGDRADLGITAPPQGLCLESIELEVDTDSAAWPSEGQFLGDLGGAD